MSRNEASEHDHEGEKMMREAPVEEINRTEHCAERVILAEKEERLGNKDHGVLVDDLAPGVKKRVVIPEINRYGIDCETRSKAQSLDLDWFKKHLQSRVMVEARGHEV